MKELELKAAVSELPHYEAFYTANNAFETARELKLTKISKSSHPDELKPWQEFLTAQLAEQLGSISLMRDVATVSEDVIPFDYKLGMLGALNKPVLRRNGPLFLLAAASRIPQENADIKLSEFGFPPSDPFARAVRIGNAIVETKAQFNKRRPTDLAELTIGRLVGHRRPTDAAYYVVPAGNVDRGTIELPPGEDMPIFSFPVIVAKKANFSPTKLHFVVEEGRSTTERVTFPKVSQLMGSTTARKLLFGRSAVIFANKLDLSNQQRRARAKSTKDPRRMYLD